MNQYEQKVVKSINLINKWIKEANAEIQKLEQQKSSLITRLRSIKISKEEFTYNTVVFHALDEATKAVEKELEDVDYRISSQVKWLVKNKNELEILQQYACPCVETVHDHFDHHRNENFDRCILCGHVR